MPPRIRKLRAVRKQARVARRRRRSPEEARAEILAAADAVFAREQPDAVGLKDVAREAGVSHALITHYFGTYAGLIEAVLDEKIRRLRARMLVRLGEAGALDRPHELLGILFDALQDPVHLRLMRWMIASERPASVHAMAVQEQGFKQICRQIILSVTKTPTPEQIDEIEVTLLTGVSAAYGYALVKSALAAALGRVPDARLDDAVQRTLAAMLEQFLRAKLDESLN